MTTSWFASSTTNKNAKFELIYDEKFHLQGITYNGIWSIELGVDGSASIGRDFLTTGFTSKGDLIIEFSIPTGKGQESGIQFVIDKYFIQSAMLISRIVFPELNYFYAIP